MTDKSSDDAIEICLEIFFLTLGSFIGTFIGFFLIKMALDILFYPIRESGLAIFIMALPNNNWLFFTVVVVVLLDLIDKKYGWFKFLFRWRRRYKLSKPPDTTSRR
jgi:hypothetical protein